MYGRKLKFACLALTSCVFQAQFLGCSREFANTVVSNFTPTFGRSFGESLGNSIGVLPLEFVDVIRGLLGF